MGEEGPDSDFTTVIKPIEEAGGVGGGEVGGGGRGDGGAGGGGG